MPRLPKIDVHLLLRSRRGVLVLTTIAFAFGMVGANLIGATVVFASAAWLVPVPQLPNDDHIRLVNLIFTGGYVGLAVPLGAVWTAKTFRPLRRWLYSTDRPPTPEEQLNVLRAPLLQARINGLLWLVAGVVFVVLNLNYSPRLALVVGISVLIGGLSTTAFSYLVVERVTRGIARIAMASETPARPAVPSMTTRLMLAWALSTGVPVLAVALIGGGVALGVLPDNKDQLAWSAVALSGVALIVGLQAMLLATRSVADPIASVRKAIARVRDGDLDAHVPVYDGSEIGLLQAGFNDMVIGLRERETMRDLFGRHVGEDVAAKALADGDVTLGGEICDVAVLFIDLIGSTELAATRPPDEVVAVLNQLFGAVVSTVGAHGGSINKFEGDAALCIFGAPEPAEDHAGDALAAARELIERLRIEMPAIAVGVGVSAGKAVAANIGAAERFEYTVIGDPVNEAARLTELAKQRDPHLLASSAAISRARPEEAARWELGEAIVLRGRGEPTRIATPVVD